MSASEHVGAAMPSVSLRPDTLAAWHRREHRSTWFEPIRRAAFWNA